MEQKVDLEVWGNTKIRVYDDTNNKEIQTINHICKKANRGLVKAKIIMIKKCEISNQVAKTVARINNVANWNTLPSKVEM